MLIGIQKDKIRKIHIFQISNIEQYCTPMIRKYVSSEEHGKKGFNVPVDEQM